MQDDDPNMLGPQGLPDLGMGPRPMPPAPPPIMGPPGGPEMSSVIARVVASLIAMKLGPQRGGLGMLHGVNQVTQQQGEEAAYRQAQIQKQQQQQYAYDRDLYEDDARAFDAEGRRKEQLVQQVVTQLRQSAATAKTKKQYDQFVEADAQRLRALGFRIDGNFLRASAPYLAPDATKSAQETLAAFLRNPVNDALLKEHPDQIEKVTVRFDRDGDGIPETLSLTDLADLAQQPFGKDATGKLIAFPKGTTADAKASADGILATLIEQDKAEGKADTPKRRLELQALAIKKAKEAGDLGPDPTLTAIRELALSNARANAQSLPPAQQRRVDAMVKGFDAQPAVKRTQVMAEAVTFARSMDPNTTNPADDQALISAFAKANDPESVVREGEYATVQKYAQTWAEQFKFSAARIFSNIAFLTPEARANMKATILLKFKASQGQYLNLRQSYAGRINRITGAKDGEDYLTDYGGAFPSDEPPPTDTNTDVDSAREQYRARQGGR